MRFHALIGLLALVFVGTTPSTAHADWREGILGNRIHNNPLSTAPAQKSTASKSKGVKTASLGTSYVPSKALSNTDAEKSTPKKKSTAASSSKSKTSSLQSSKPKPQSFTSTAGSGQVLSGKASYYWQPQKLASGGYFNPSAMTAAHKTLPFGTKVRVTNERNGKSVVVTINDRGPYIAGRIIDLSSGAAGVIAMKSAGVVPVKVTVLGK